MDWSELKKKALELKDKGKALADKAMPYMEKATDFVETQFQASPLVLKNMEAYTEFIKAKKCIILIVNENDETYKNLMLRYPVLASKAWTMVSSLRMINTTISPDFMVNLKIEKTPLLIVTFDGFEYTRVEGLEAILAWFDHPRFCDEDSKDESTKETPSKTETTSEAEKQTETKDPLAEMKK